MKFFLSFLFTSNFGDILNNYNFYSSTVAANTDGLNTDKGIFKEYPPIKLKKYPIYGIH